MPEDLMTAARDGDAQALGALLEACRPHLLAIARRGLPGCLRGKCDETDLVQETLLEAHRGLSGFTGGDLASLQVWLVGILRHNLKDCIRRYCRASKRRIARERSLEFGRDSGDPAYAEVDPAPTPCACSIAREEALALREALARLPGHERSVIFLRHFEALCFQEIGLRIGRSPEAARKLDDRAIARLQRLLDARLVAKP